MKLKEVLALMPEDACVEIIDKATGNALEADTDNSVLKQMSDGEIVEIYSLSAISLTVDFLK